VHPDEFTYKTTEERGYETVPPATKDPYWEVVIHQQASTEQAGPAAVTEKVSSSEEERSSEEVAATDSDEEVAATEEEVAATEEEVATTTAASETTRPAASTESEKQLLEKFKAEEDLYNKHLPVPQSTRRLMDHPVGDADGKIGSLSRLLKFMKDQRMKGSLAHREDVCNKKIENCDSSAKYRSFDGTCNNLKNPSLGSKNTPFTRLLPPAYTDKVWLPRGVTEYNKKTGGYVSSLPSPRAVSAKVFADVEKSKRTSTESKKLSHMAMQWGQFIDHDMVATAKTAFDCCHQEIRNLERCFPISVGDDDPWFSQFGRNCLDFTRSLTHCRSDAKWQEQFNKRTGFLDGSMIYGSSDEEALTLRGGGKRKGGRLVEHTQIPHFLPDKHQLGMSVSGADHPGDYVAGDDRAQVQPTLLSMHALFLNEHNRIAGELFSKLKDKKGVEDMDELVFQETRRLVIAMVQHITYNEFLPEILGEATMNSKDIHKTPPCNYNEETDPTIISAFSTAAFRFGHSMVQDIFKGKNQPWKLGKAFIEAKFATKDDGHGFVNELEGCTEQPAQEVDQHICESLTEKLYVNTGNLTGDEKRTMKGLGSDLGAINIQRGRDHGLPSYNSFRKHCGLSEIKDMNSAPTEISAEAWQRLRAVYTEPEQIDLYPGGLSETHVEGGSVGPTFSCIISRQFKNLMDGDRFFYMHDSGPGIHPLTGKSLEAIQSRRLGDIICENTNIALLAENVFLQPVARNQKIRCIDHRRLDLAAIAGQLLGE